MGMTLFYNLSLLVGLCLLLPKFLFQLIFQGKYRKSVMQRLGKGIRKPEGKSPVIWLHAVSVGETRAAIALARRMKEEFKNSYLVVSSVTETGHAEAKRALPFADNHIYLPFDLPFLVNRAVCRVKPDLVILTEGDLWFNFLRAARRQGAKLFIVSAKMSERSAERYARFKTLSKTLFSLFELICVQNEHQRSLFVKAGAPPEVLKITGNLKFDETAIYLSDEEKRRWREELGLDSAHPTIVVGSTHAPEEKAILDAFHGVWKKFPACQLVIAPRHPERFGEVVDLLKERAIPYRTYSERKEQKGVKQVVLIDAMGLLRCCYQLADLAIVAGSYTAKVGGHNVLEPCLYGIPVLFGPHMQSQRELRQLVLEAEAGLEVSLNDLERKVLELLEAPHQRSSFGDAGRALMERNSGAVKRTWDLIAPRATFPSGS